MPCADAPFLSASSVLLTSSVAAPPAVVSDKAITTPHLSDAAKALGGRTVAEYGPGREPFLTWHCNNVAG